jgi:hypothetical protein
MQLSEQHGSLSYVGFKMPSNSRTRQQRFCGYKRHLQPHKSKSACQAALSRCGLQAPHLLGIMKHLSSCLHQAGVAGHSLGGSAEALGESTARFEHDRPDGMEGMSSSYRAEMWRRLHIRIVLSRMGCFANPHQDQLSTDSCIVLFALHAGSGGVGQWRIALLDPSYLLKTAHTATADGDRAGAVVTSYFVPLPSDGTAAIATYVHRPRERLLLAHAFADAKMEKGHRASGGSWCRLAAGAPCPSRMRSSSSCAGSGPARRQCQPTGASSSASRAQFTGINWGQSIDWG